MWAAEAFPLVYGGPIICASLSARELTPWSRACRIWRGEGDLPPDRSGDAPTCIDGSDPGMEDGNVGQRICADEVYGSDMNPPAIEITFPEPEAWFDPGSDFTILADVTDDRAVVSVELYLDNEPLFRITEPPWQWDVTNIPEGDYMIGAIARDSRYYTESNVVEFHVGEMPPSAESGESSGSDGSGTTDDLTTAPASEGAGTTEGDTDDPGETSTDDKGCGCTESPTRPPAAWVLLLLLLPLTRRRAR